jgi:hypothetical protein
MPCPLLDYRSAGPDREFDAARAYCTAAERFVQPLRADICTDRYALEHSQHCEIYQNHREDAPAEGTGASPPAKGSGTAAPDDRRSSEDGP